MADKFGSSLSAQSRDPVQIQSFGRSGFTGVAQAPSHWCRVAWISTTLCFTGLHFSSTLHAGKRAKWKYEVTRNKYSYSRWTHKGQCWVSVFTITAEHSRWSQWRTLFMVSEQLLYTQPHLCLSPALRKSLLFHATSDVQERDVLGLTQYSSLGPHWTKSKLAPLSWNRKGCITTSSVPLPGTRPRSQAESPSSRWLSECLSYLSRWHCSNLMQGSF